MAELGISTNLVNKPSESPQRLTRGRGVPLVLSFRDWLYDIHDTPAPRQSLLYLQIPHIGDFTLRRV